MARPSKTGLDYFPFDIDFFEDEKIEAIFVEFGIKGEITVVKLLCAIYRNGYYIQWNQRLKIKLLKNLPGISSELLEQIINRLVKWEFFNENLFHLAKILTSSGIQKRFFSVTKRRKQNENYPHLLINVGNNVVNVCNNSNNVDYNATKESKEKEINYSLSNENMNDENVLYDVRVLEISLDECFNELVLDTYWSETVTMNIRRLGYSDFTTSQFEKYIKNFFCELKGRGEEKKSPVDAKHHFFNWLKIELEKQKRNGNKNSKGNKRSINPATDYARASNAPSNIQEASQMLDYLDGKTMEWSYGTDGDVTGTY